MKGHVFMRLIMTIGLLAQLSSVALATVCDRLDQVRVLPFKNEKVEDKAYYAIVEGGEASIPCLVANVVNTNLMPDPRKAPGPYRAYAVGDLAINLLCKITGRSFEELLPPDVRASYDQRGVAAYFDYVKKPENRVALQKDWQNWLAKREQKQ